MKKTEKFIWHDKDITLSQCFNCLHLLKNVSCAAFPERIPLDIRTNEHDHRKPYPGDNGIRFEPIKDKRKK